MVSFNCCKCQDVIKKPKVIAHASSCGASHFCCVDCNKTFDLYSVRDHTACVSEVQKYQGKWTGPVGRVAAAAHDDSDEEGHKKTGAPVRRPRIMSFDDTDLSDDEASPPAKKTAAASKPSAPAAAAKRTASASPGLGPSAPPNKASRHQAHAAAPTKHAAALSSVSPARAPSASSAANAAHGVASTHRHGAAAAPAVWVAAPVAVSFEVAANDADFRHLVAAEMASRWPGEKEVSIKAVTKAVCESLASNKALRKCVQKLVGEHCKIDAAAASVAAE